MSFLEESIFVNTSVISTPPDQGHICSCTILLLTLNAPCAALNRHRYSLTGSELSESIQTINVTDSVQY